MELRIDNQQGDLTPGTSVSLGWSSDSLKSVEALREGLSITLELPSTPINDALLQEARLPHGAERFNFSLHRAQITQEGVPLFEGVARLRSCSPQDLSHCYRIELRGGAADWAKMATRQRLDTLPILFDKPLLPSTICDSWGDRDEVVRFLPIASDDYRAPYAEGSMRAVEQLLSVDDFHPFLHLKSLLEAIFVRAGYTVESDFLQSDFFRSLYISGAYPSSDTAMRKKRMDFLALRSRSNSAVADATGRVYATPFMAVNTVGNLVDAYLPNTPDEEGNPLQECFSTNDCFRVEEGEILFRPLTELKAGFEYHLRYRTDYRIQTRHCLAGFDGVYLGEGADYRTELPNRFVDRREELIAGQQYRIVVFDHRAGESLRLRLGEGEVVKLFSSRSELVTLPSAGAVGTPWLERLNPSTNHWEPYTGDWALYDGYVEECGTTEAELRIRTAAEPLGPTSPKYFRHIYFYGAEPGMTFTLLKGSSLRPTFSSRPGYGERLTWSEISCHDFRQAELVEAVAHLFNLRIFSDEEQRVLFIEPYGDFYEQEQAVDWSDKVVSEAIRIEQSDAREHEACRYGYLRGDGAVERLNQTLESPFGEWLSPRESMATLEGEQEVRNRLFAPTLNDGGHFEGAPSALVLRVGNRDREESVERFEFTPRIVSYRGLKPLPVGEWLGAPVPEGVYPLAAFHLPKGDGEVGVTLCFEDRDGVPGLHRFHDPSEEVCNRGEELLLTLRLGADEFEALRHRSTADAVGLDALFLFRLGEENVRCRLEAIESYEPLQGRARCRFSLLNDDRP